MQQYVLTIRVLASVGHGKNTGSSVLELAKRRSDRIERDNQLYLQVLVRETSSVDRLPDSMSFAQHSAFYSKHTSPPVPSPRAIEAHVSISRLPDQDTRTEVATLDHEVLDDAVELGSLVAKVFGESSTVLFDTSGESAEVLYGLRDSLARPMLVHV